MHERALNSLLSYRRLNRMLSSDNSIKGNTLKYYELFDNLYESVFQKINPSDQIKRNLQISFTQKIIELITNEDLKDGIKSKALSIKQKINKISYRKSKSSNSDIVKDHFNYIVFLTNDKD
jgi:hypothetical protein